jgi:hypothetical protein
VCHELHTEQVLFDRGDQSRVMRAGQALKYSPLLREQARKVEGEKAVLEPVY